LWHFAVKRYLKRNPVDLYFAPTSYLTPALLKDIPFVFVVHDLISFLYPKNHKFKPKLIERFFLPRILNKAKFIVVVSENTKKDLISLFPHIDPSKIKISYCGANLEEFKPADKKENLIFSVGTLIPRKNFKTLIKAFNKIKDDIPHTLKIAGGEGEAVNELNELAGEKVELLGYTSHEQLRELYSKADIFVYPSLYEGFGIPVLEAMASGCPIICSNRSSLPEVIGNCGIKFDPENTEELSQKILTLAKKPDEKKRLKKCGIERAKDFSWIKVAEKVSNTLS